METNIKYKEQLDELYKSIETLKKYGMTVPDVLLQELSEKEKSYIDNEVISNIESSISGMLSYIHDRVTFIVECENGCVSVTRQKEEIDSEVSTIVSEPEYKEREKPFIVKVTFPDGKVVCERIVRNTLAEVVRYAGCENVYNLRIPTLDSYLVSKTIHDNQRYAEYQIEIEPGYYLLTTTSPRSKSWQIEKISRMLNLGLIVERVPISEAFSELSTPTPKNEKKHQNQNRNSYSLNGGEFTNKARFVVNLVEAILDYDPDCSFKDLQVLLPLRAQNNRTLVTISEWNEKSEDAQKRYYLKKRFHTADGVEFYVSTQWTKDVFDKKLLPAVESLGFSWEEKTEE